MCSSDWGYGLENLIAICCIISCVGSIFTWFHISWKSKFLHLWLCCRTHFACKQSFNLLEFNTVMLKGFAGPEETNLFAFNDCFWVQGLQWRCACMMSPGAWQAPLRTEHSTQMRTFMSFSHVGAGQAYERWALSGILTH